MLPRYPTTHGPISYSSCRLLFLGYRLEDWSFRTVVLRLPGGTGKFLAFDGDTDLLEWSFSP
jgi:hypothetical protein